MMSDKERMSFSEAIGKLNGQVTEMGSDENAILDALVSGEDGAMLAGLVMLGVKYLAELRTINVNLQSLTDVINNKSM